MLHSDFDFFSLYIKVQSKIGEVTKKNPNIFWSGKIWALQYYKTETFSLTSVPLPLRTALALSPNLPVLISELNFKVNRIFSRTARSSSLLAPGCL